MFSRLTMLLCAAITISLATSAHAGGFPRLGSSSASFDAETVAAADASTTPPPAFASEQEEYEFVLPGANLASEYQDHLNASRRFHSDKSFSDRLNARYTGRILGGTGLIVLGLGAQFGAGYSFLLYLFKDIYDDGWMDDGNEWEKKEREEDRNYWLVISAFQTAAFAASIAGLSLICTGAVRKSRLRKYERSKAEKPAIAFQGVSPLFDQEDHLRGMGMGFVF